MHYKRAEKWTSPFHVYLPVIIFCFLVCLFLAFAPFIPPKETSPNGYPFYVFPLVGVAVLLAGAGYWYLWKRVWPKTGGYRIETERYISEADGTEVVRYRKVAVKSS